MAGTATRHYIKLQCHQCLVNNSFSSSDGVLSCTVQLVECNKAGSHGDM